MQGKFDAEEQERFDLRKFLLKESLALIKYDAKKF